jgi:alginate O-acetyltransferase complex protein AlgI
MSFTTVMFFFAFLPVVLLLYYIMLPSLQNFFMLLASLAFYSYGSSKTLLYLIVSVFINWLVGLLISELKERSKARKTVMFLVIIANVLGVYAISNILRQHSVFLAHSSDCSCKRHKHCVTAWHQLFHIPCDILCA